MPRKQFIFFSEKHLFLVLLNICVFCVLHLTCLAISASTFTLTLEPENPMT